ncbi:glucosamine-6-phosphate deaminase [Candidatus Woesearchaeota archaeon]|nr:glucosamine-6-phosphate deaminase [Candidatus Woesearchaeota archaeon]
MSEVKVAIYKNADEVGRHAARLTEQLLRTEPDSVLGLATGSSPVKTGYYPELVRMRNEGGLDLSKVATFNLDEYLLFSLNPTLDSAKDQSYRRYIWEHFLKNTGINTENMYIPDGLTPNPDRHCQWYDNKIKEMGGIDLQILGVGSDGHIGFNEPGSPLNSRTRVVPLHFSTLVDNYHAFVREGGYDFTDMPVFAITMGVGTIMEAREIILLAAGESKSKAIKQLVEEPITSQITASKLQEHPNFTVVVDEAAAKYLGKQLPEEANRPNPLDSFRYPYITEARKVYDEIQAFRMSNQTTMQSPELIANLKAIQKRFLKRIFDTNFGGIQELLSPK